MRIAVVTLFPELFAPFAETSFVGRAIDAGTLVWHVEELRSHGLGVHRSVDDTPYGGGSGMVLRVDCVVAAMEAAEGGGAPRDTLETRDSATGERAHRVLLTPQGARFTQDIARSLAEERSLVLVCGRYEGFDERVRAHVDRELSIGDYVLTGGEVAAMVVVEAIVRLLPGVLGNAQSTTEESFAAACGRRLEYPHYTRPLQFRGAGVPEILRSGDHAKIAAWRQAQSEERTRLRRPDLLGDVEDT